MFELKTPDWPKVKEILELLALPPRYRRLLVSRISRLVIAQAKENIKEQKTIDGSPMIPRKSKEQKIERAKQRNTKAILNKKDERPMFKELVKHKWLRVKMPGPNEGEIYFFRNAGVVAHRHQYGKVEHFKLKIDKYFPLSEGPNLCSPAQALFMARRGVREKNGTATSKTWMTKHLTVIAARRLLLSKGKPEWDIVNPARPFLGVNDAQIQSYREYVMQTLHDKFRAKNYKG